MSYQYNLISEERLKRNLIKLDFIQLNWTESVELFTHRGKMIKNFSEIKHDFSLQSNYSEKLLLFEKKNHIFLHFNDKFSFLELFAKIFWKKIFYSKLVLVEDYEFKLFGLAAHDREAFIQRVGHKEFLMLLPLCRWFIPKNVVHKVGRRVPLNSEYCWSLGGHSYRNKIWKVTLFMRSKLKQCSGRISIIWW